MVFNCAVYFHWRMRSSCPKDWSHPILLLEDKGGCQVWSPLLWEVKLSCAGSVSLSPWVWGLGGEVNLDFPLSLDLPQQKNFSQKRFRTWQHLELRMLIFLESSSSHARSLTPMKNSASSALFLSSSFPLSPTKPGREDDNPGPAPGLALSTRTKLIVWGPQGQSFSLHILPPSQLIFFFSSIYLSK